MSSKRDTMPKQDAPLLHQGLTDLLLETETAACPPLEQMNAYAQEALPASEHAQLKPHIVECPLCASTNADLRRAFRQILVQHRGLAGWFGPLLAYLGFLSGDARRQWRNHTDLCARCRQRTERLQILFSPPITAAAGAAVAVLLLITVGSPKIVRTPNAVESGGEPYHTIPKGGKFVPSVPGDWPTSVSVLENYLYPTKNLDEIEKYWRKILDDHPENLAAHEALGRIYRQRAAESSDPRRKAGWQERAQAESDKLTELANKKDPRSSEPAKGAQP